MYRRINDGVVIFLIGKLSFVFCVEGILGNLSFYIIAFLIEYFY